MREQHTMKTPKQKPSRKRAARSPSSRTDQTANAQPQTTPAPSPTPTPTPAPTAPAKRKLPGFVSEVDMNGWLKANLVSFTAAYIPGLDAVGLTFHLEDYRLVALHLDHVFARSAIATFRQAVSEFCRFHRGSHTEAYAHHPACPQLTCYRLSNSGGVDEEIQCEFLPKRDLIRLGAIFSDSRKSYSVWAYLTRAEAEALMHDLERGLADLERYGDIGEI